MPHLVDLVVIIIKILLEFRQLFASARGSEEALRNFEPGIFVPSGPVSESMSLYSHTVSGKMRLDGGKPTQQSLRGAFLNDVSLPHF
jgi:hypothetical protein